MELILLIIYSTIVWFIFFKKLIARGSGNRFLQFIAAVGITITALALHFWSMNEKSHLVWLALGGTVLTLFALGRDRKLQSKE